MEIVDKMMTRYLLIAILIANGLGIAWAAPTAPLLMPGKQALYQRILTVPGASLADQAGGSPGDNIQPFSAFYVYQRKTIAGVEWLQIGTDRHGSTKGWIDAADTLEWSQGLTVAFRDPVGHDRSLLFKDRASLETLAGQADLSEYNQLYQAAVENNLPVDSPVVAIQPAGHIDIKKNFYLVPIRDHADIYLQSEKATMLQVASVPLVSDKTEPLKIAKSDAPDDPAAADFKSGLVFAIDSTLSMDPYIDRTRQAVMKIYDNLGDSGLLGNVNFGLVAFRDSPQASPELEYLAKTFVTLEEGSNPGTFIERVNNLSAATVSSKGFIEDAYAGVKLAIEDIDWTGHQARYVVLITDAGPRDAGDPLSSSGLNAAALRQLAHDKGIAIFVLHLLTPSQMADHALAESQYRELSMYPDIGSLYYGVPTGDVNEFGEVLDSLAQQISNQVGLAANQETARETIQLATENLQLAELQSKVAKLGYALRMQYLQQTDGQPPRVFDAWVLDRDFRDPQRSTLDIRVLLTRDQLSDLHDVLKQVLITAEEGLLSPQNFLDELKSLAATISRNPEQLGETTASTAGQGNSLADLGFMREYIEGLPYTGEVMNLSLEDWQSWPAAEQIRFLNGLEEKINYYHALHDHTDLWISLDGGPVGGDAVFPLALEMLP